MKIVFQIILILFSVNLFGQNYSLNEFTIDSLPFEKSLFKANNSMESWVVEKISDSIKIRKNDYNHFKGDSLPFSQKEVAEKLNYKYAIRAVKKVDDGYLIGFNQGEFGGGLWFLSADGKSSYEIAPLKRIHQIFKLNDKLYVTEGLAHLGSNNGNLLELKKDEKWNIFKTYKLPGAPDFIIREKNNVLILTSEHLMRFTEDGDLIKILKAPFYWGMLYPSSAIIENNDIYIAMRKGILKISNFEYVPNYEWYIKK